MKKSRKYKIIGVITILFGIIFFYIDYEEILEYIISYSCGIVCFVLGLKLIIKGVEISYNESDDNTNNDDTLRVYNELLHFKKMIDNEQDYDKKLKILDNLFQFINTIPDEGKLNKYIIKKSTFSYMGYESELGRFYKDDNCLQVFLNSYKNTYEITKKRLKIKKEFSNQLKQIPQHKINLSNDTVKKQKLADMKDITFGKITRSFNKERLLKFVVIDVETTGLSAQNNKILEISAIKFVDFEPVEYFSTLINPQKEISKEVTKINSITNEMVLNAPSINEVIKDFDEFVAGYDIVGYNTIFDLKFLYVNGSNILDQKKIKYYDALELAKKAIDLNSYSLESVCHNYSLYREDAHRSLSDCFATALIFDKCIDSIINN